MSSKLLDSIKEEVDELSILWDELSPIKQIYSFSRCATLLSLFDSSYKREFIQEKSIYFKVKKQVSALKNLKLLSEKLLSSEIAEEIKNLNDCIIYALISYQTYYLFYKIISDNSLKDNIEKTLDKMTRQYRNNNLFDEEMKEDIWVFELLMEVDALIKGMKPHKKGIASHVKRYTNQYSNQFVYELFQGVKREYGENMSDRQKYILVFKIIEYLDLKGIPFSNKDNIKKGTAEFGNIDEYRSRAIKSQIRGMWS